MSRKFITKHENGQIRSITTTLNGVLEGEIKYWHKNGHIGEEGYLQNGNANGEFKSWYECGRIHERKFYKNGKLDGETTVECKSMKIQIIWIFIIFKGNVIL